MVLVTVPLTIFVSITNVAVVAPPGMTTVAGTTTGSLLVSATVAPTAGAGAVSVIVPPMLFPPITLEASSTMEASAARRAVTVSAADCMLAPFIDAPIVAVPTDTAVIVNAALDAPAATATLDGTVATAGLLLVNVMLTPPDGAAVLSVTVPCPVAPAVTLDAASETAATPEVVEDVGDEPPH